ncbi:MAG TPA: NADH-quinone oxidoreductase subunit C [Spirochaetia bacterium]|nr:NADH-quinone oxidoreductase subunit C [Spirochaetia bacterium]
MTKSMTREELLGGIKEKFKEDIIDLFDKSPKRVYIEIKPESIIRVATYIFRDLEARFNIATGVDVRTHMEILYHFSIESMNVLISLRVKLDRSNPEVDSLAPHIKATNWIEREMHELLGINFKGHPNLKRLLLAKEWPEGVYPLRQDYEEWDKNAIRDRGV